MILKRYSVCENRFCEYTIDDNELEGCLEDLYFEDKDAALEKCKELNLEQQKNSIYKQNEIIAQDLEVAEKIQIFIKLTDGTCFAFKINPIKRKFKNFISKFENCGISEIKTNRDNKIKEIIVEEI